MYKNNGLKLFLRATRPTSHN